MKRKKQKIIILGSSGSIGVQTLDVIRRFPDMFKVCGLSVLQNVECLEEQVSEFHVPCVCISDQKKAEIFQKKFPQIKVYIGKKGIIQMIKDSDANIAVLALVGEFGTEPARAVLQSKKHLVLATKEVMVVAGEEIMLLARKNNVEIRPIDSEHSAIWQCLRSGAQNEVRKIWITCSGGPFHDAKKWSLKKMKKASISDALQHPNWNMGKKISIDSATLMNKALELIEAVRLFQIPPEKIEIVIHPESLLHSAVEFSDGSLIGQIGTADMRVPIAYSLFFPSHCPLPFPKFSFFGKSFHFEKVDEKRFPSIQMARCALQKNRCREFNMANEKAVSRFLSGEIGFLDIYSQVKESLL